MPDPDVLIHLRPLPAGVPADHRVRALLKLALRRYRLRCVGVRELGVPPGPAGPSGGGPAGVETKP